MHPLLRTLDLTGPTSTESSVYDLHPIRDSASARAHGLPVVLSLGLTPLLIYGLSVSLISPDSLRAAERSLERARNSVALLLEEPDTSVPVRPFGGPESLGGAGHREGTNSLDPRLQVHTPLMSHPSEAIDPENLDLSPRADQVDLSLNPALPSQPGGNGLARGTGPDPGLGRGGSPGTGRAGPDLKMVPIRQVAVYHNLSSGENATALPPVRVRILVNEDGVPIEAKVISGPAFLHKEALKAAWQWRFEPLGIHGLKGPQALTLNFYPQMQP